MGLGHIRQRLDRAIANDVWKINFPEAGVLHLTASKSDHNLILLKLWVEAKNKARPFRFEAAWLRDRTCYETINKAWKM